MKGSGRHSDGYGDGFSDLELFKPQAHARKKDPATSRDAAGRAGGLAVHHCGLILDVLKNASPGGLNFEEIAKALGFANTSRISRRMIDLERQGLIFRTGETRATQSGRAAQVWRANN
jgi:hypothetical protein